MKERIQKVLANAGVASRRSIEQMILDGRISVNGHIAKELPVLIDPAKDAVEVDGERIRLRDRAKSRRLYILMNKPRGVYTTNVSQGEQLKAIDLLPPGLPGRVYPVGRLDADSKGLLLLTNDGDLTNRLTHPRFGVPKTYRAIVDGYVAESQIKELEQGIWLADKEGQGFKTGKSHFKIVKRTREKTVVEVTIREARHRQVRRMLAKVGHRVKDLTRVKMGPLTLEGLSPGQFRELTPREVKALQKSVRQKGPKDDGESDE
jgi:23S rRNA pseudouridine2605 synthase